MKLDENKLKSLLCMHTIYRIDIAKNYIEETIYSYLTYRLYVDNGIILEIGIRDDLTGKYKKYVLDRIFKFKVTITDITVMKDADEFFCIIISYYDSNENKMDTSLLSVRILNYDAITNNTFERMEWIDMSHELSDQEIAQKLKNKTYNRYKK